MNSQQFDKMIRPVYRGTDRALHAILGRNTGVAALEFVSAFIPPFSKIYCATRERLVRPEFEFFQHQEVLRSEHFHKVVMVGGGAIPITAMYWASHCNLPVIVLEKGRITSRLCRRQLKRHGLKNASVLCVYGEDYDCYANSIVLISLHATNKSQIVSKVMESRADKKAISVRALKNEELDGIGIGWVIVRQYRDFDVKALITES
jgi:hypothetical protein